MKYKQLGQEQRHIIGRLLEQGENQSEIARVLGYHRSTISREIRRNTPRRGIGAKRYDPNRAQMKTERRHKQKPKRRKFTEGMRRQIVTWLRVEKLSPELMTVLGRLIDPNFISHETIYKWIWAMKFSKRREDRSCRLLYRELRHGRRKRKRGNCRDSRGQIPNRVSIEKRPAVVEKRTRLGDMENDLMLGKNGKPGLFVSVCRTTLKTFLAPISTKEAGPTAQAIVRKLKNCKRWLKTMTYDNDMAFADHASVNKLLDTKSFFTHPFTSQEKGTVENRIGLLRRFFPKRCDFSKISARRVSMVEKIINSRPVRKFNYKTPDQVFETKLARLKL